MQLLHLGFYGPCSWIIWHLRSRAPPCAAGLETRCSDLRLRENLLWAEELADSPQLLELSGSAAVFCSRSRSLWAAGSPAWFLGPGHLPTTWSYPYSYRQSAFEVPFGLGQGFLRAAPQPELLPTQSLLCNSFLICPLGVRSAKRPEGFPSQLLISFPCTFQALPLINLLHS